MILNTNMIFFSCWQRYDKREIRSIYDCANTTAMIVGISGAHTAYARDRTASSSCIVELAL